jgi:hypothetical protein
MPSKAETLARRFCAALAEDIDGIDLGKAVP